MKILWIESSTKDRLCLKQNFIRHSGYFGKVDVINPISENSWRYILDEINFEKYSKIIINFDCDDKGEKYANILRQKIQEKINNNIPVVVINYEGRYGVDNTNCAIKDTTELYLAKPYIFKYYFQNMLFNV